MISLAKLLPGTGCGDNSCRWGARGGMGTNGGCGCAPRTTQMAATLWRGYALALEARIAQQPAKDQEAP